MNKLSVRLLLAAAALLLIAGGDFRHSPSMALYQPSLDRRVWMPDGSSELSELQKRRRLKHTVSPVEIPTGWSPCQLRLATLLRILSRSA